MYQETEKEEAKREFREQKEKAKRKFREESQLTVIVGFDISITDWIVILLKLNIAVACIVIPVGGFIAILINTAP